MIKELPFQIALECEFSKADLNVQWQKNSKNIVASEKFAPSRIGPTQRLKVNLTEEDEGSFEIACVGPKNVQTSAKLTIAGVLLNFGIDPQ